MPGNVIKKIIHPSAKAFQTQQFCLYSLFTLVASQNYFKTSFTKMLTKFVSYKVLVLLQLVQKNIKISKLQTVHLH